MSESNTRGRGAENAASTKTAAQSGACALPGDR